MSRAYAQNTKVPEWKSGLEIQTLLRRGGCSQVGSFDSDEKMVFLFALDGLTCRLEMPLVDPADDRFIQMAGNQHSDAGSFRQGVYDQEVRRRWRALVLIIKAKLVAIQEGIVTFEEEFLPYMVTGSGATVGETVIPQMKQAAIGGSVPSRLALPGVKQN